MQKSTGFVTKPSGIKPTTKDEDEFVQEQVVENRMPHGAPQSALIVDDDPAVCGLIQTILRSAGMESSIAANSTHAVELLRSQKFSAVFLDLNMPSPTGIEVTRLIRASGSNQDTTVVIITGEEDPSVLGRAFQAGADFFMFKPLDNARLLKLSRAAFGAAQREKRHYQRVVVSRKVQIMLGQDVLDGETIDVSLNGLRARVARTFAPGSQVSLRLYLSPDTQPINASGTVVRLTGPHMGIHIENIAKDGSKKLQDFLLPWILVKSHHTS